MKVFFLLAFLLISLSANAAITIGTYNIRNFDYDERYRIRTNKIELSSLLKSLKTDVLNVQEINNTSEFESFVANKLPGYDTELSRCGGEHGQHLGFLFNKSTIELLSFNEDLSISNPGSRGGCDTGSRPMAIGLFQIKSTKQKFYGISVHLKSGSAPESKATRTKQLRIIKNTVQELKSKTGVADFYVAGDFNSTEYLSRGTDYKEVTSLARDLAMNDLASNLKCSAYWWGNTDDGIETPSLLDHLLITPGLSKGGASAKAGGHCQKVNCREVPVRELGIIYESVSDHCPVTATIQ